MRINPSPRLGLPCFEPEGAFYMFPDIREFGMSSEEFAMDLLEQEKVAVVPGSAFGESGEGFIRISYAYSIDELKEALMEALNGSTRDTNTVGADYKILSYAPHPVRHFSLLRLLHIDLLSAHT